MNRIALSVSLRVSLRSPKSVAAVYSDASLVDADGRPARRSYLDYLLDGAAPPHGDLFVRIMAGNFLQRRR